MTPVTWCGRLVRHAPIAPEGVEVSCTRCLAALAYNAERRLYYSQAFEADFL